MKAPSTLRLRSAAAGGLRLAQLLVDQLGCSWSEAWRMHGMFALSGPELALVRLLLDRRPNLWLYRTNQRHACGDLIAVDMSARRDRPTYAIELKSGEPLRTHVGGRQFAGLAGALAELAGVIGAGPVVTAQGDSDEVVRWIGR